MKKLKLLILFIFSSFIIISGCSSQAKSQDNSLNDVSINETSDSTIVSIEEIKNLLKVEPIHYSFTNNRSSSMKMSIKNLSKADIIDVTLLLSFISEESSEYDNPFYLLKDDSNRRFSLKSGEEQNIIFTIPNGYLPGEYNPENTSKEPVVATLKIDGYIHSVTQKNYFNIEKLISF